MRSLPLVIAATLALGGVAHAETLQISAGAPATGLPAVSGDGMWFARPVIVQPADCKGTQTFVELGTIRDDRPDMLLVKDDCSSSTAKLVAKNVETVNKKLTDGKFRTVGKLIARPFGGELDIDGRRVTVSAGSGNSVIVAAAPGDRWTVTLEGAPIEVRGWYAGKTAQGRAFLAIAVAVKGKDVGARGRERWLDFSPTAETTASRVVDEAALVEIGSQWVDAMRKKDRRSLRELISTPFWKVGLTPVSRKACKRKQKASRTKDVAGVADCIASGVSQVYSKYTGADTLSEIELAELPDELRRHKRQIGKLMRGGDRLVRYYVNDDDILVALILVIDAATDYQTVQAALEYIDAGDVTENY